jgi:PAS domain S-box-containing protein
MLWMGDADGACVYLNRRQREFWGVPGEDLAGFDWGETIHPDDRERIAEPLARAMREHVAFSLDLRMRRADGAYRRIQTMAQPRFGDGGFLGMIGVNVDVTELRETEAAIRSESERLAILNRTGAAIAAELDVERIVQLASDACRTLIGAEFGAFFYNVVDGSGERYTLYSLSGVPRSAFEGFPMPRATPVFHATFHGEGIVRSDDIRADPRYGHTPPHYGMPPGHLPVRSYLAVPVVTRSGEVIGGLFFGHSEPALFTPRHEEIVAGIAGQAATALDNGRLFAALEHELAQRREAEAALQVLNETLEQRIADAIAERLLAEEALRQAQKMEAIGRLTGGVAHDFNNLMQVISGNLQLLARDLASDERASRRIADALAGVASGAKLASQLLAFSRRQPLAPKVLNVGRLVSGMGEMLRRTIGEGVEVATMASDGLWNSLVDPGQLETAVLNLALNGRDAMGGLGRLTIEVGNAALDARYAARHPEVRPGDYVVLAVSDTGVGIPADILDRVFDPFFSTKPLGTGTGLGLSMVYGFVRQSGGHVNIYSEPGHGTTVRLYLPRVDRSEEAAAAEDQQPVVGGDETILVAEDDDRVRATVVEILGDLGYRVLAARDGASALEIIEGGAPIDLLFTDVVMPGRLRGPELARQAQERRPGLAVLFTSGYTENAIMHGGRLDPGIELLSKPYSREALARKIRQVLASRPRRRPRTVLFVEDDALIRLNSCDILQEAGFRVLEAGSAAQALAALDANEVDICVVDVGLPDIPGTDLARRIRERDDRMPLLFATGHLGVPEAATLAGAAVLSKPYGERELRAAVESLIEQR